MSYIRQEWPLGGGDRLVLLLATDGPTPPESILRFGQIVKAVEDSGLLPSDHSVGSGDA